MEINTEGLLSYSRNAIRIYGEKTLEDRAIPDYRDGMKPVARRLVWAAHKLGMRHTKGYKKSARLVGDTLGKYHPHGDSACYGALVTAVQSSLPMFDGQGNWGSVEDPKSFAAHRYTECRLSKYADSLLLSSDYLPVITQHPNFDSSVTEPLVLPALLPNILLNGALGIAVGGTTSIPAFKIKGIKYLVSLILSNKKITAKTCLKHLAFNYRGKGSTWYGEDGKKDLDSKYIKELMRLFNEGKGSATFVSNYELIGKTLRFYSWAPKLNFKKAIEKCMGDSRVKEVIDCSDLDKSDLPILEVTLNSSVTASTLNKAVEEVAEYFDTTLNFNINVTTRRYDDAAGMTRAELEHLSVISLLEKWVSWRISLEIEMIDNKLVQAKKELKVQDLYIIASNNKDIIRKSWDKSKPIPFLMKRLKITESEANFIYDFKLRALTKLDTKNHLKIKDGIIANIKQLKTDRKKPELKILQRLQE